MKNNLVIFSNDEFSDVRVITIDGEPWFVGKDVCLVFKDSNHSRSLKRVADEDKIKYELMDNLGRPQTVILINESGLYSLLFAMQPQKANKDGVSDAYPIEVEERIAKLKKFKHWVTTEVLPSIRKNGGYILGQEQMSDDELFAKALLVAQNKIAEKDKKIQEQKLMIEDLTVKNECQTQQIAEMNPKATYYDEVLKCNDAIQITKIAKDYGWSGQQMNNFLHDQKVQYNMGGTWLLYKPYQNKGYTKTETYWFKDKKGNNMSKIQTKWTQTGRLFIYELMKRNGNLPIMEKE